jgi:hypothetical protein
MKMSPICSKHDARTAHRCSEAARQSLRLAFPLPGSGSFRDLLLAMDQVTKTND